MLGDLVYLAHLVANAIASVEVAFGILFCSSANGIATTANRNKLVRAGIFYLFEIASSILARFVSLPFVREITPVF